MQWTVFSSSLDLYPVDARSTNPHTMIKMSPVVATDCGAKSPTAENHCTREEARCLGEWRGTGRGKVCQREGNSSAKASEREQ